MTYAHEKSCTSYWLGLFALNRLSAIAAPAVICILGAFHDCPASAQKSQGIVGIEHQSAMHSSVVGEWINVVGDRKIAFRLTAEGGFSLGSQKGQYMLEIDTVILKTDTSEVSYQFELAGNELTLSGGDLKQAMKFTRVHGLRDYEEWLSYLSPKSLMPRLKRIAVILLITVVCRVLLLISRIGIRFVIYSDLGPLKFVYSHHKNRTLTIYSLLIDLSKYVVYLAAFGFVLTELGINYTAYLASLSVVGLAIGFGSQGLVQDMVTGFFIVFEEQFDVGDMVEVPPHVGVVQELGLRMTRLRNYLGQEVVIPNRNIATVGNYMKGAQHVYIDIAAANAESAEQMKSSLAQFVGQIAHQFEEVILATTEAAETVSLLTGEHFVRVSLSIWPQQQWVVDQELVPRIRSLLKNKDFEIPNDKVTVFYHPREQQSIEVHRVRSRSGPRVKPLGKKKPEST